MSMRLIQGEYDDSVVWIYNNTSNNGTTTIWHYLVHWLMDPALDCRGNASTRDTILTVEVGRCGNVTSLPKAGYLVPYTNSSSELMAKKSDRLSSKLS
ncbi:hypothetical protein HK100_000371 [Physocladia obscura]|uniref:Uncharacterized protein n=1 Tax=Physocladia obscura TaxID=109957 RepID=A0AAD5T0A5_9FUNG|nr:hypothetical protein HK100_000371 [Physocladia obscura]